MKRSLKAIAKRMIRPQMMGIDEIKLAIGRQESRWAAGARLENIQDAEFQVFSQWGEDGIIQYLIHKVAIANKTFVEFGVEDYSESNTRFLLVNDNWSGLVMDGSDAHIAFAEATDLRWRYDVQLKQAFVTRENINSLLEETGISGDIGIYSVDIDGNDYWVIEETHAVSPRILIAEYNSTFGPDHAITVPYDVGFVRSKAHYSHLYWGASLGALCHVAEKKGYTFVGSNSSGNNAFFARNDVVGDLPRLTAQQGWMPSKFRESRDRDGILTYVGPHRDRLRLMAEMPVVDVTTGKTVQIGNLFGF